MTDKTSNSKKINIIMRFGEALHQYGATSMRLEQALEGLADKLNFKKAQFFSTPTSLMASFQTEDDDELSRLSRVQPGGINLGKLSLVDELAEKVADGVVTLDEGQKKLQQIIDRPVTFTTPLLALGYATSALCFSVLLHAPTDNYIPSFIMGLFVGTISSLSYQSKRFSRLYEPMAAFFATVLACIIGHFFMDVAVDAVILAGLIPLVPGLAITVSLSELATNDLTSGTTRMMGAITTLIKIIFGIIAAKAFMGQFFDIYFMKTFYVPSLWIQFLAPLFASLAFSVMFRAHARDRIWIVAASILSFSIFRVLRFSFDMDIKYSVFVAGLALGAGSNLYARLKNRPALITLLPGILLLVPGSFGYRAMDLMSQNYMIEGINTFFEMFLVAMGLVAGLLFGNILITPRKSL
jgi:uncharacterized membrane protein YjjP (DUF1212 family)